LTSCLKEWQNEAKRYEYKERYYTKFGNLFSKRCPEHISNTFIQGVLFSQALLYWTIHGNNKKWFMCMFNVSVFLRKIQPLGNVGSCGYILKTNYQSVFFVLLGVRRGIFDPEIYVDFIVADNLTTLGTVM
jgi:hypothetical protein